tara:strand:- start:809 stop:988 length:180 start_codon:yes stop_codon:yes gene_type:complete
MVKQISLLRRRNKVKAQDKHFIRKQKDIQVVVTLLKSGLIPSSGTKSSKSSPSTLANMN